MAASLAMMAMTTNNSMKVTPSWAALPANLPGPSAGLASGVEGGRRYGDALFINSTLCAASTSACSLRPWRRVRLTVLQPLWQYRN